MRGLIFALFCGITIMFFVGLSMLSQLYAWPLWLSIVAFILAVIIFTYLMARLTLKMNRSKQEKQQQKEHTDDGNEV